MFSLGSGLHHADKPKIGTLTHFELREYTMKNSQPLLVAAFSIATCLGVFSPPLAAEQLDLTRCYSGSGTIFNDSKDAMQAVSWAENGIIISHSPSKLLDNAVTHCEGVEHGLGANRTGYGLCKIVDDDGDVIIANLPYTGFNFDVKFLAGTGKWKGIKGSLHSERLVRSKPGKGAMPGTYQGCRREQGTFELTK